MGTSFKCHCKRISPNGEAVGHPMANIPGLEKVEYFATSANFSALDMH